MNATARITTPFLFRINGKKKPSPVLATARTTARSAPKTTPRTISRTSGSTSPGTTQRPTKLTRRRYSTRSSTTTSPKAIESQGTTVQTTRTSAENRHKFVSRKPFFRSTTSRLTTLEALIAADQTKESSNQQSLEEDPDDNDTTELGDIALALQSLQQAPVRKNSKIRTVVKSTTPRVVSTPVPTRVRIKYSTTASPVVLSSSPTRKYVIRPQAFEKINPSVVQATFRPFADYDYYGDGQASILGSIPEHSKVLLHSNGIIECLDQGNFPHPLSCRKFISCAKMENGNVLGWEYTCPINLSFDPIGGMCNWSAGLGCSD